MILNIYVLMDKSHSLQLNAWHMQFISYCDQEYLFDVSYFLACSSLMWTCMLFLSCYRYCSDIIIWILSLTIVSYSCLPGSLTMILFVQLYYCCLHVWISFFLCAYDQTTVLFMSCLWCFIVLFIIIRSLVVL